MAGVNFDFDKVVRDFDAQVLKILEQKPQKAKLGFLGGGLLMPPIGYDIKAEPLEVDSGFVDSFARALNEEVIKELPALLNAAMVEYDLIDTGRLRDSLQIINTGTSFDIRYSAPYAGLVHEGGYILPYGNQNAEKVFVPGRPWINMALKRVDYEAIASRVKL